MEIHLGLLCDEYVSSSGLVREGIKKLRETPGSILSSGFTRYIVVWFYQRHFTGKYRINYGTLFYNTCSCVVTVIYEHLHKQFFPSCFVMMTFYT